MGIGGVGLNIPKIAMNPMLICLKTNACKLSTARGRVSENNQAPLEIPPILLEDVEGRGAIDNSSICANENEHTPPIGGPISRKS